LSEVATGGDLVVSDKRGKVMIDAGWSGVSHYSFPSLLLTILTKTKKKEKRPKKGIITLKQPP